MPNFALKAEMMFTDGISYDEGGYGLHVDVVMWETGGKIFRGRQSPDGSLVEEEEVGRTGRELEEGLREHYGKTVEVDITAQAGEPETVLTLSPGSEDVVRGFLAEADVVGRALGMGNIEICQARETFDKWCDQTTKKAGAAAVVSMCDELGFGLTKMEVEDVMGGRGQIALGEWVKVYHVLDEEGSGVDMV